MPILDACENLDCLWGSRCEKGRCVCPQKCPKPGKSQEVCGSDGRLYHSECHLLRKECEQNRKIELRPKQFCSSVLSPLPPDPGRFRTQLSLLSLEQILDVCSLWLCVCRCYCSFSLCLSMLYICMHVYV